MIQFLCKGNVEIGTNGALYLNGTSPLEVKGCIVGSGTVQVTLPRAPEVSEVTLAQTASNCDPSLLPSLILSFTEDPEPCKPNATLKYAQSALVMALDFDPICDGSDYREPFCVSLAFLLLGTALMY